MSDPHTGHLVFLGDSVFGLKSVELLFP